jgi:hypothetical protein
MGKILTSLHGRQLGLDDKGRLVLGGNRRLATEATQPLRMPYLAYVNTAASATITNTVSETVFDTNYSIPANSLQPGELIRCSWQGIAPSTNATDTLTIRLRLGGVAGTVIVVGTATDVANNAIFAGRADIIVRTVGSSGTFVAFGSHTEAPAASGTAVLDVTEIVASTTLDTTAAQVLNVTAQWSVASASNQCRLDLFSVERW